MGLGVFLNMALKHFHMCSFQHLLGKDPIGALFQPRGALSAALLTTVTNLLKTTDGDAALSHTNNVTQRRLGSVSENYQCKGASPVFLGRGEVNSCRLRKTLPRATILIT